MLRAFSAVCIAVACAGCTTYSTDFLVGRDPVAGPVVYRPQTAFVDSQLRLQIPWIEIHGCADNDLRFKAPEASKSFQWHVVTAPAGTIAYFEQSAITHILASPDPVGLIVSSAAASGCLLRLRSDVPSNVRKSVEASNDGAISLLKTLVAERLPSPVAYAWKDQYDYDPATRSMNLLPGMRLKVTHESPATTDAGQPINETHVGLLAAPVYLHLWAAPGGDAGLGTWTPALSHMQFNAGVSLPKKLGRSWFSATGLNELTQSPMFWRLYVPRELYSPRLHVDDQSALAQGNLNVTERFPGGAIGYPGFVLMGAKNRGELAKFNAEIAGGKSLASECHRVSANESGICLVLRFRAIQVPEIPVVINGEQAWVEVGATLRDILSTRAGHRLRSFTATLLHSAPELAQALQDQALVDALGSAVVTRPFGSGRARLGARSTADLASVLGIPLQIGDEITWAR
jgi:hypothetical protein